MGKTAAKAPGRSGWVRNTPAWGRTPGTFKALTASQASILAITHGRRPSTGTLWGPKGERSGWAVGPEGPRRAGSRASWSWANTARGAKASKARGNPRGRAPREGPTALADLAGDEALGAVRDPSRGPGNPPTG